MAEQRTTPSEPAWDRRRDTIAAVAVALLAVAVFANSLPNGFVYDDVPILAQNTRLDSPWDVRTFFGTSYWHTTQAGTRLYRPLTLWAFAIERALFGPGPAGVHVVNVVANAAAGVLLFVFLRRLLGRRVPALLASLLFAVHPVHTEVVANGVGQAELLAFLCMMLGALCHLHHLRPSAGPPARSLSRAERRRGAGTAGKPPRRGLGLGLALGFTFVGLLFKESAVVLPGIMAVADWLILQRGDLRAAARHWRQYALYAVPLGLYLVIRAAVVGRGMPAAQEVMAGANAVQRVFYAGEMLLRGSGQTLVPWRLCAEYSDYTRLATQAVTPLQILLVSAGMIAVGVLLWWCLRRRLAVPALGICWFLVAISPVSNILFLIGTVRAERLLFAPSAGIALCLGWALHRLWSWRRIPGAMVTAVVLTFYVCRTVVRNPVWRSTETLWPATVAENPGTAIGWSFVGDIHREHGDLEEAALAYRRAFELREKAGFFYPEARNHYATVQIALGNPQEAEEQYRTVLRRRPRQRTALNNLGELLLRRGAAAEAVPFFEGATEAKPSDFRPWANLSQAYAAAGRNQDALAAVDRAIRLAPAEEDLEVIRRELLRRLEPAPDTPPQP
ncbi:MAG: tetratricopeptide repeat protein [Lentisphaeria bacterium]|nr:tetratricopeptide repeat protein [Lentisphaeria bacterium]